MNMHIHRHRDYACSVLELDSSAKNRIRRLGREAQSILAAQDQELWRSASSPDFLPRLMAGAIILQRIGLPNDQSAVLEDDGAHLAFMTCMATAMVAADLDPGLLPILKETIQLLAYCCSVRVTVDSLPPLGSLPERLRTCDEVRRQYENFARSIDGPRDVVLAEALALLRVYQHGKRPEDAAVMMELFKITEGLRTALDRVDKASQPNGKGSA